MTSFSGFVVASKNYRRCADNRMSCRKSLLRHTMKKDQFRKFCPGCPYMPQSFQCHTFFLSDRARKPYMDMIYLSIPINIAGPEKRVPMPFQRIIMLVFSAEHRGYSGRIVSADLFMSAHKSCSQTFGQRKRMGDERQRFTPQRVSDAIRLLFPFFMDDGERDGAYGPGTFRGYDGAAEKRTAKGRSNRFAKC